MAPFIGTKDISTKRYESSVMKPLIDADDMFELAATDNAGRTFINIQEYASYDQAPLFGNQDPPRTMSLNIVKLYANLTWHRYRAARTW
jgi:hypothetical protein